jgi:hypothetical protein
VGQSAVRAGRRERGRGRLAVAASLTVLPLEVRRRRDGIIPDIAVAVASPQRLSSDPAQVRRVLDLVPGHPTVTWGRDELGTGEMWNSNSVIGWLLARSGHRVECVDLPERGRAPLVSRGWFRRPGSPHSVGGAWLSGR